MIDINNWLGKQDKISNNPNKDWDEIEVSGENSFSNWLRREIHFCFLSINDFSDGLLICIHKEDEEESVNYGLETFKKAIINEKKIVLYNFKDNTYKKWNPIKRMIDEGTIPLVDFESLIDVIKDIKNSNNPHYCFIKSGRFNRFYFAVIYKLLKEGMFGTKNNDLSCRDFVNLMNISGLDAGEKSNLDGHTKKLEGKSPKIQLKQNDSGKSQETQNRIIKSFVEEIISRYSKKSHKNLPEK